MLYSLPPALKATRDHINQPKLIDLQPLLSRSAGRFLAEHLTYPVEKLLSVHFLNTLYAHIAPHTPAPVFFHKCLEQLRIRYACVAEQLQHIPQEGPVVVVANHPFGGLEGLILGALLTQRRNDVKYLGNYLLQHIAALRDWVIPVDPFGHTSAIATNAGGLKTAMRWVQRGGMLITFPAGEVSHLHWQQGLVTDVMWSTHVGAIVRYARAAVVPIYFSGRNSVLFQGLGLLHRRFRTMLLAHELANKCHKTFPVVIGKALPWSKLRHWPSAETLMAHVRLVTYCLDKKTPALRPRQAIFTKTAPSLSEQRHCGPPASPAVLTLEIGNLPDIQRLVEAGEFVVYLAQATQIPAVLQEIGRLREVTFRSIGEGTGKTVDLDRFDRHYLHLFLWHTTTSQVVGAYRLGLTDVILQQHGVRGLYTNTLFRFHPTFFARMPGAIELGRAFIRVEYQRQYGCLGLLWKGIGAFLVRQQRYTRLFGPVSISQEYHATSQNLMVQFLQEHKRHAELAAYVTPRHPYHGQPPAGLDVRSLRACIRNVDDMTRLIEDIEESKSLPTLLHYYLHLGATLLGVNVDKHFSNVIDGLILVDLTTTQTKLLRRFLGQESCTVFTNPSGAAAVPPRAGAL